MTQLDCLLRMRLEGLLPAIPDDDFRQTVWQALPKYGKQCGTLSFWCVQAVGLDQEIAGCDRCECPSDAKSPMAD